MTFLSPIFLMAAAVAVVPLILHLIARRKTLHVPFGTIRFLKLAQKQSSTKSRLQNLLLWLLRTLLLLLLAFAFARPVARLTGGGALLGSSRRDVAIVWDASYSMSYEVGGRSVWEASKDAVVSIIRGLSKGDRVSIILAADPVTPLIAEPTNDLDFAIATVKAQEFHYTPSSLADATLAALDSIKTISNERELFIVTDGQRERVESISQRWQGTVRLPARRAHAGQYRAGIRGGAAAADHGQYLAGVIGHARRIPARRSRPPWRSMSMATRSCAGPRISAQMAATGCHSVSPR